MKVSREFDLKELVEILLTVSKKNIPELAPLIGLKLATVYNWHKGQTKRVNVKQIQMIAPKLKKLFGVEVGKVTRSGIELLNIPADYPSKDDEAKVKYEVAYIREVSYLINKLREMEEENSKLKKSIVKLVRRYEPGRVNDEDKEADLISSRSYSVSTTGKINNSMEY